MIRITMQSLATPHHPNVTKKEILKVLFQVRDRLSYENIIKNYLVYYWYKEGPYSEVIYSGIEQLVQDGIVKKYMTDSSEVYRLEPKYALIPLVSHDDYVDEASDEIRKAAEESVNINEMIRGIYASAPFKLYEAYSLEFMPKFESHFKAIRDGRESTYNNSEILNLLDDAVLAYPQPPKFMEHRRIFMDFAKMLNAFLRSGKSSMRTDLSEILLVLSHKVWDVFVHGVRIDHHDHYYDDKVVKWTRIYKQELAQLDIEICKHIGTFETDIVDDTRLAPDIEDMIQHPEKYKFTPVVPDTIQTKAWPAGQ